MQNFSENSLEKNQKNFLVSELPARYGIEKSAMYERLKKLYIKSVKNEDGNASITPVQLELMDGLAEAIKGGTEAKDFVQQCIESGRIVPPMVVAENQAVAQQPTEQNQAPTEQTIKIPVEGSQQNVIAELQAAKGVQVRTGDIKEVHESARDRAFAMEVAEESLVSIYRATESFTPEQKQMLEQHRNICQQANASRKAAHNVNDFLSQAVSGFGISPNFSSNPSPSSTGVPVNA